MTSSLTSTISSDIRHSAWFDDLDDETFSRLVAGSASRLYREGLVELGPLAAAITRRHPPGA